MFEPTADRAEVIQESVYMNTKFKYRHFCTCKVVFLLGMRRLTRGLGPVLSDLDWD